MLVTIGVGGAGLDVGVEVRVGSIDVGMDVTVAVYIGVGVEEAAIVGTAKEDCFNSTLASTVALLLGVEPGTGSAVSPHAIVNTKSMYGNASKPGYFILPLMKLRIGLVYPSISKEKYHCLGLVDYTGNIEKHLPGFTQAL
mgnify:FL=1